MPRRRAVTTAALACLLAVPAVASAAPRIGAQEERGPVDRAHPQADIRTAAVAYDPAGSLRTAVAMGGRVTPTNLSGVELGLGTYSIPRGWCQIEAHLAGYPPEPGYEEEGPFGGLDFGPRETDFEPAVTLANGLFTITADTPLVAGKRWSCARVESFGPEKDPRKDDYVVHDATAVFPLISGAAPNALPRCGLVTKRARRGGTVAFRCAHAAGPVTVRLYQGNRLKRAKAARLGPRGGAAVRAIGLRRGAYQATVWRGRVIIGQGRVAIR